MHVTLLPSAGILFQKQAGAAAVAAGTVAAADAALPGGPNGELDQQQGLQQLQLQQHEEELLGGEDGAPDDQQQLQASGGIMEEGAPAMLEAAT